LYGGPGTGIGQALRKARQTRGKSIQEASRDTHIRTEYLQALEREAFGSIRGDVYVRGFLRSYSTYLGLNPDKVVGVYVRAMGGSVTDVPEPLPVKPTQQQTLRKVLHRRGNWALAVAIAVVALGAAGAIGVLTRGGAAPVPAVTTPLATSGAAAVPFTVSTDIRAIHPVAVKVIVDGQPAFSGTMHQGGTRSFEGADVIKVSLGAGKSAELTVNGQPLGRPGVPGHPYTASFGPKDFRRDATSGNG
jgi:cytoskeleton protein RodZ